MEWANISSRIEAIIKVVGKIIRCMGRDSYTFPMASWSMMESGRKISPMDGVF
jgi:hypothetical protein